MEFKSNLFTYFSIAVFNVIMLFIIICGVENLGKSSEYNFLYMGAFLIITCFIVLLFNCVLYILSKEFIHDFMKKNKSVIEFIILMLILITGLYLRIRVIKSLPMKLESDYKTYYDIARLLQNGTLGTEGEGLCDYIAKFPHVMGYPYILSLIFRIFGDSLNTGLYFGALSSILCSFFIYKIVRYISGSIAALFAVFISTFWPSQIFFSNFLASEPVFNCMLFGCFLLFVYITKKYNEFSGQSYMGIVKYIILGMLLAFASAVRPMAMILLIAIIIVLLSSKIYLKKDILDTPVSLVFISKGWRCVILILVSYLICSNVITAHIEDRIGRNVANGIDSFGYNLLVGTNIDSDGGWNDGDAKLLEDSYNTTNSATEAQKICRDKAITRVKNNYVGTFNLMFKKFTLLWNNDDYSPAINIICMDNQGTLNSKIEKYLYDYMKVCNYYYLFVVIFSWLAGMIAILKKSDLSHTMILLFIGTVITHMCLESQPRYHYYAMQIISILGAVGVGDIYKYYRNLSKEKIAYNSSSHDFIIENKHIEATEESSLNKMKNHNFPEESNFFDMEKAIIEGHVKITVTEEYSEKI